jgi:hypothetical protein
MAHRIWLSATPQICRSARSFHSQEDDREQHANTATYKASSINAPGQLRDYIILVYAVDLNEGPLARNISVSIRPHFLARCFIANPITFGI